MATLIGQLATGSVEPFVGAGTTVTSGSPSRVNLTVKNLPEWVHRVTQSAVTLAPGEYVAFHLGPADFVGQVDGNRPLEGSHFQVDPGTYMRVGLYRATAGEEASLFIFKTS